MYAGTSKLTSSINLLSTFLIVRDLSVLSAVVLLSGVVDCCGVHIHLSAYSLNDEYASSFSKALTKEVIFKAKVRDMKFRLFTNEMSIGSIIEEM
ncbi:hypothetical protein HK100_007953 [Physocladia obscura]|uniref:Uncharacterized protein n=1 Tax=Physocladia obscura TaxID=109957 RepID=A0AAD5XMI8_9FUNG|nr:hypothetical protein HK100_007953 [Physocladia obscura]